MEPVYALKSQGQVQILQVDNLLTEYVNRELLAVVQGRIDEGFTTFVIDLEGMAYTNSVGLNFLIAVQARCQDKGGDMAIINISSKIRQLLEITKLAPILCCCESLTRALDFLDNI